jgi:UDP-N-acetylmuramate dehydrogenase
MNAVSTNAVPLSRLFREAVGQTLRHRVSLRRHSSFRIGGTADYFFSAQSLKELRSCLLFVRERALPYYVIGAGTNILFSDAGFRGLILKNEVKGISTLSGDGRVEVFSGTPLSDLVGFAVEKGLEGLEFAAGIPGTVGGAVFGNAGAFGQCIGELLTEAALLDGRGEEFRVERPYFEFAYRHSALKSRHAIIMTAVFKLNKGDRGAIKARIEENLEKRHSRHPSAKLAYAGSYFKNPVGPDGKKIAAGHLLEKVGAKDLEMGGAAVFSGHANFILNRGRARAKDVLRLSQELKERVKKEFGIDLEEEVIYLPEDSSMP